MEWNLSHKKTHYISKDVPSIAKEDESTVKCIDLSNNYIFQVDEADICHLFNLTPTEALPCPQFTQLIKLNLAANNLSDFPSLKHLPNLQFLKLSNNKITSMSAELQHVKKLRLLDLRFNRIVKLEHLEGLNQLESLTMSSNQLISLDGLPVHDLNRLEFLGLFGNRLSDLELVVQSLSHLHKSLRYLYLSGNPICPVPIIDQYNQANNNHQAFVVMQRMMEVLPLLQWFNDIKVPESLGTTTTTAAATTATSATPATVLEETSSSAIGSTTTPPTPIT